MDYYSFCTRHTQNICIERQSWQGVLGLDRLFINCFILCCTFSRRRYEDFLLRNFFSPFSCTESVRWLGEELNCPFQFSTVSISFMRLVEIYASQSFLSTFRLTTTTGERKGKENTMNFVIKIFTFSFCRGWFTSCPICPNWTTSQKLTIHSRNGTFCLLWNWIKLSAPSYKDIFSLFAFLRKYIYGWKH